MGHQRAIAMKGTAVTSRTGASAPAQSLADQSPRHQILRLQQAIGNRAVQRLIQQQSQNGLQEHAPVADIVNDGLRSPGNALDAETRAFMESAMGFDFSGVRVHTDSRAADSAEAVNAKAYTVGQEIVFGAGEYAPGNSDGKRLIAHELVHVGQQGSSPTALDGEISISDPSDDHERAADAVANQVLSDRATPSEATEHPAKPAQSTAFSASATTSVHRQENTSGTVTLPETVITGAADPAAYNQGYSDGEQFGQPRRANELRYAGNQKSLSSYSQGVSDAMSENPYQGPSIGPGPSREQLEADKEAYKAYEELLERRREFMGEIKQEPPEDENKRPREAEPIYEVPELVE